MILENKVALVTGGTSGIGRATAVALSAAGAKVVFSGICGVAPIWAMVAARAVHRRCSNYSSFSLGQR